MKKFQRGFIPVLIIFILAIVGVVVYIAYTNYYKTNKYPTVTHIEKQPAPYQTSGTETPTPSPTPLPIVLKSSDISWITPVRVASLGVFKTQKEINTLTADNYGGSPDISKFYFTKVADLSDGSILVNGYFPRLSFYGVSYINFIIKGSSVKVLLDETGYYKEEAVQILSPNIPIQYGKIEGLDTPGKLSVGGTQLYNDYPTFEEFSTLSSPTKFADTDFGDLYVIYNHVVAPSPLFDRFIYLKLKNGLAVRYAIGDKSTKYDNNVQKFTWSSGGINDIAFASSPFSGGCGGSSNASTQVIKGSDIEGVQKETVGTDANNNSVYKLTDSTSSVLKTAYKQYSDTHSGNPNEKLVSYNDFLKDKNNILIKDSFNDWVFYLNPNYAQLAECGKPVIYLYPTTKQEVSVQVGAKITKSEPLYPNGGWNVVASPDGNLNYKDSNYPYLFWEGLGNGIYPQVKDRGVVIKKEDVENKLREDLKSQGLNSKETSDFLEFWLPKMPNKPFIRLTWLNTLEMNILAPLSVSPKPNTTIRVFLDFAGLDKPVMLTPQKLFAPERKGFTLIEWGGLLVK